MGYPSQFVITYVPRGDADNPQLVRKETWFYPDLETKIGFLGGKFIYEDTYIEQVTLGKTPLKPQDFDYFLTYKDLEKMFGIENIVPVDFMPVFYEEEERATYLTDLAFFIIENNQLTYFQTISASQEQLLEIPDTDTPPQIQNNENGETSLNTENEWETHTDTVLQMKIKYPSSWFIENNSNVLSSYDTGYLEKGLELPEKRLKCDFFVYKGSGIEIGDPIQIINKKVSVYEGKALETHHDGGPGLGDSHLFVFKEDEEDTIALICYSYHESFYATLLQMLETFEYMK